jgi:thiamine-monophosphate kinase
VALGEFGRIGRYFAPLAGPGGLGLKDDAALVGCEAGRRLVVTVDAMVAGVHFLPDDPPDLVARKLLRTNLSDLAAMGARPLHYLLTSALPASLGDEWVGRFAAGLGEDQRIFGVDLLGGDSVATSGPATFSLTAIGDVAEGREIRRGGAKPGDLVWVSGTIGDAGLGLAVLKGGHAGLAEAHRQALAARFQLPQPRTTLGPRLVGLAHAMLDVSDGLLADLGHICEVSGVAATVEAAALPLSEAALAVGGSGLRVDAATAGDDYELLFAAPPEAEAAIRRVAAEAGVPVTAIGAISAGTGVKLIDAAGQEVAIARAGYRHF